MWTFNNRTGWMTDPGGTAIERGYAGGNEGKNPEGKNNPAYQYTPDIGPLPVGLYTMGTPVLQSHLGPFAIPLQPDPSNDMQGRGDFFVHGDTTPSGNASEGCIIMSRGTRTQMYTSTDHQIIVVST
jgi:hypothetical protein